MSFERIPTEEDKVQPAKSVGGTKKVKGRAGVFAAALFGFAAHSAKADVQSPVEDLSAHNDEATVENFVETKSSSPYEHMSNEEVAALDSTQQQEFRDALINRLVDTLVERKDEFWNWTSGSIVELEEEIAKPDTGEHDALYRYLGPRIENFAGVRDALLEKDERFETMQSFDDFRDVFGDDVAGVFGEASFGEFRKLFALYKERRDWIGEYFSSRAGEMLAQSYPTSDVSVLLERLDAEEGGAPYREAFRHLALEQSPTLVRLAQETSNQQNFENALLDLSDSEKTALLREVGFDVGDLDMPERFIDDAALWDGAKKIEFIHKTIERGVTKGVFFGSTLNNLDQNVTVAPRVFERMVGAHLFDQSIVRNVAAIPAVEKQ